MPLIFAEVWREDGSEPAFASVKQNAPKVSPDVILGRKSVFCFSDPAFSMALATMVVTEVITDVEAQLLAISSKINA